MKTAKSDPLKPSRADHRLIKRLLESSLSGKVTHTVESYDLITRVFARAGGSWEKLFLGSSSDMGLLKKVLKVAYKTGHLMKAPKWR